mmetsp:Transcript_64416/g.129534  ORF Transcript_64416/g.129534 Transcript_64416/m.129534 type:complete len:98 (-) Transcript_64416:435-728(-)
MARKTKASTPTIILKACAAFMAVFVFVFMVGKVWNVLFDWIIRPIAKKFGFKKLEELESPKKILSVDSRRANSNLLQMPALDPGQIQPKNAQQKKDE